MKTKLRNFIWLGIGYLTLKWLLIGTVGAYLYKTGQWSHWYFLLIPIIGFFIFKIIRVIFFKRSFLFGYRKSFFKILKSHYPETYKKLLNEVEQDFAITSRDIAFASKSKNPLDKRLDFSAYFLSLVRILNRYGESYQRIKEISIEVATDYVKPKNKLQAYLKKLPVKLINTRLAGVVFALLNRKIKTKGHPDGFKAHIITDKGKTLGLGYGIDIHECGICKLFNKHHAQEYTSILCEVDKITTSLAGLEMIRTGTIAKGASRCDFRYRLFV
ncbi:MAG: L-2-amino-thiazoline-4-carboxylic acid hydrolase [Bacteroidota bacterium]